MGGKSPVKAREDERRALVDLSGSRDRPNWTLPRLAREIETRTGHTTSRSRRSVVLRKKGLSAGAGRATP